MNDTDDVVSRYVKGIKQALKRGKVARQELVQSRIDVGRLALRAKKKLGHGNGWQQLKEQLPISERKLSMHMKIAKHPLISANIAVMPSSLVALYDLSRITDEKHFQKLIDEKSISPDMTCNDASVLFDHYEVRDIDCVNEKDEWDGFGEEDGDEQPASRSSPVVNEDDEGKWEIDYKPKPKRKAPPLPPTPPPGAPKTQVVGYVVQLMDQFDIRIGDIQVFISKVWRPNYM
jgi:hypothetical protein